MICEVCGEHFTEDWRKTENRNRGEARFCSLNCARKNNARKIVYIEEKCSSCGETIIKRKGSRKLLCDNCYNRKRNYIKKSSEKNTLYVKRRRLKLKTLALEYKGNKCQICGYNKYFGALQFHHLDHNEKEFGLSQKGLTRSWDKIKKELDKCILVCANCHAEIHAGIVII